MENYKDTSKDRMTQGMNSFKNSTEKHTQSDLEPIKPEYNLSESEEIYKSIADISDDLIAISTFDLKPVYTYVSPSHLRKLGYEQKDLLGKPCFDFIHPKDKGKLFPILKKYVTFRIKKIITGKQVDVSEKLQFRIKDKYNEWHYIESIAKLISNNSILYISRDITENKKVEEELKKYREHLEELVKERTKELEEKNIELERFNQLFVGREFRINELKQEIKSLKEQLKSNNG